jgi:hypothetical protein
MIMTQHLTEGFADAIISRMLAAGIHPRQSWI